MSGGESMKLRSGIDIVAFLRRVNACGGRVEFVTAQGDRLDLKSTLARYILAALSADGKSAECGQVVCENPGDAEILREFLTI